MSKKIVIIGAGFGGMTAAAYLAKQGHEVVVVEKNSQVGGRAQVHKAKGFTFDLGPSWYMMPDVFDEFFSDLGLVQKNFYTLKSLQPHYRVVGPNRTIDMSDLSRSKKSLTTSEHEEKKLTTFFDQTKNDYHRVRRSILLLPMTRVRDVLRLSVIRFLLSKNMFRSYRARINSIVKNEDARRTLQFMSVFMGGSPKKIPAVYALLGYVDMGLGVKYPMGGFVQLTASFKKAGESLGVTYKCNAEVKQILTANKHITGVELQDGTHVPADIVISNADYHHTEKTLLSKQTNYQPKKWNTVDMSPSALLIVLGVKGRVPKLKHHTLFLESDWEDHFKKIESKEPLQEPLFYVSTPSKSDPTVAPARHDNLFILVPLPSGTIASKQEVAQIERNVLQRISNYTGVDIKKKIVYKKTYNQQYFIDRFHAFRGNAFGPSHTLLQSAIFRPKMKSKSIAGLYFAGQYTNPGTGVPMTVLSGKAVSELIKRDYT